MVVQIAVCDLKHKKNETNASQFWQFQIGPTIISLLKQRDHKLRKKKERIYFSFYKQYISITKFTTFKAGTDRQRDLLVH